MATGRAPSKKDLERLGAIARATRTCAYAPYSRYKVGAAVLGASGRAYGGCNVENASYGLALCAERSAVATAIAAGERSILACAVVTGGNRPGPPCGMCRQVLAEFADLSMPLRLEAGRKSFVVRLRQLLPLPFGRRYL